MRNNLEIRIAGSSFLSPAVTKKINEKKKKKRKEGKKKFLPGIELGTSYALGRFVTTTPGGVGAFPLELPPAHPV